MMNKVGSNNAYDYSESSQPQKVTAYELINQNKSKFRSTDILVDIGCGTGAISIDLLNYVGKVYAFDISEEAIDFAKARYPNDKYTNIVFFVGNAKQFTLPEKVDWVFSANSLHWLDSTEQKSALLCISQVLKDDGKLIITFGMRHEPLWSIVDELAQSKKWSKFFINFTNPRAFYKFEEYKKLLLDADFEIQSIQEKPIEYKFKNIHTLLEFVKSWLPHLNCLAETESDLFLKNIGEEYLKHCPSNKDGYITMTFNVLEVCANKFLFGN